MPRVVSLSHEYVLFNGRIYLQTTFKQQSGGEQVIKMDVTDQTMKVTDEYLDHHLGLDDYKYENGRVKYIGEDKDRYF